MILYIQTIDISPSSISCENLVLVGVKALDAISGRRDPHGRLLALASISSNGCSSHKHLFVVESTSAGLDEGYCRLTLSASELLAFHGASNAYLTMLDNSSAEIGPWYQIPEVGILHLIPVEKTSLSQPSRTKPVSDRASYLREQLVNKLITWSERENDCSVILITACGSYVACKVMVDVALHSLCSRSSSNETKIGRMTDQSQLLIYFDDDSGVHIPSYDGIRLRRNPSMRSDVSILRYVDPSNLGCLSGAINALSQKSATINSNQSYLVIGESGSGGSSLVESVLASHDVTCIHVSPFIAIKREGEYNPKRTFAEAFRCADMLEQYRPCVLLIEDLHCFSSNNVDDEELDISQVPPSSRLHESCN